jgi:hypothetical protein
MGRPGFFVRRCARGSQREDRCSAAMSAFWHEGEYGEGKDGRSSPKPPLTGSPSFKSTSWSAPAAEPGSHGGRDHGRVAMLR